MKVEIDHQLHELQISPQKENVFTFSLPQEPKLVNFDFESTWIKEMTFEKSLDEFINQLENDPDVTGKTRALYALTVRAQDVNTTVQEK